MQRDRGKDSATTKSHGRTITWIENINVSTHNFSPITGNESLLTRNFKQFTDCCPFAIILQGIDDTSQQSSQHPQGKR